MREDISHMLSMPEGVRRYRVSPAHWRGGYYEVISSPSGADVIGCIHTENWQERSVRVQQRFRLPRPRRRRAI